LELQREGCWVDWVDRKLNFFLFVSRRDELVRVFATLREAQLLRWRKNFCRKGNAGEFSTVVLKSLWKKASNFR